MQFAFLQIASIFSATLLFLLHTSKVNMKMQDVNEINAELSEKVFELKMELERKKEEVQLKNNELKKLEDLNSETKKA